MLATINDGPTGQRLAAERAFLAHLDGSCETPIGGLAELDGVSLRLRGEILRKALPFCGRDSKPLWNHRRNDKTSDGASASCW